VNILLSNLYYGPQHQALITLAKNKVINPPLGLLQMATMARKRGHCITVVDEQCTEGLTMDGYVEIIRRNGIKVVGFSVNTLNFNYFVKLSLYVKERTGCVIVAGGVHITALQEKALLDHVDYLFLGEADHALADFLDAMEVDEPERIRTLPGLVFANDGKIINNGRTLVKDLDNLPFADRGLLDHTLCKTTLSDGKKVLSTGISASRGCPFKCVFCAEQILTGNRYRCHSPEYVFEEMRYVQDTFGISHINFYDSTFNIKRANVLRLCRLIINSGRKFTFWVGARASLLDKDQLAMMKQAGLVRLGIAIESGNEAILKLIRKNQTRAQLLRAFRMAAELSIPTEAMAIIGNPGDTLRTMFETAEFIRKIHSLTITSLGIAIPYPGTELHQMARNQRYGLKLLSDDWDKYHIYGPGVMQVNGYSPAQMVFLQKILLTWSYMQLGKIRSVARAHGLSNILGSFLAFLFKPRR
jgi:anaerobic magnesium-protoporphyrin IX monomethyl ester cyclase